MFMVPIWLTGSKIFYHPRKSEGPRKMSPRSQEELVLSIPAGADHTGQQPHTKSKPNVYSQIEAAFQHAPSGKPQYPKAANVQKHLC